MKCKVLDCGRDAVYKSDQLCQKHYFRMWRNGTTDLLGVGGLPSITPNGYRSIYAKGHPIAIMAGRNRVFEHRVIFYDQVKQNPTECDLCGRDVNWSTLHIDHINNNRLDNRPENLRCLCRGCNTKRGYTDKSYGTEIEYGDRRMTPHAWAREPDVHVGGSTIKNRIKSGMTIEDALFLPKKTHKSNL